MPQPIPKLDTPLLLAPDFKEKIWGREELNPLYADLDLGDGAQGPGHPVWGLDLSPRDKDQPALPRIGEAWLTGGNATFLSGPVAGLTLAEVLRSGPQRLCGPNWSSTEFPLLAKFLFTSDWLSMQVHPNDDYAARHEKSRGKTEAWYIIAGADNAEIALALPPGTTRGALEAACRGSRTLDLALRFKPARGEVVYVPAGTLHALGPNLVLFEVSETSDVTYRLDDYGRLDPQGRPRQLHLERGVETTRIEFPGRRDLPKIEVSEEFGRRRYALACRHFAVEELVVRQHAKLSAASDRVECLAVIAGAGRMEMAVGWLAYRPGQTWVIPAGAAPYRLAPEKPSLLIRFYVPDLDRDFRQPLERRGVSPSMISQVVFDD